ncbi:MAG: polysaccharide export protein [Syntrophobacteraceae bacterium]|nr:polysaccharide export protein [Syntrophobacteraceae bacterium]
MAAKSYSKFVCLIVLLGLIVSAGPAVAQGPAQDSSYKIGPNDILNIFVWKEVDLTRDVTVMPDGKITFPLIGEMTAQGLTASELKKAITDKLQNYVTAPEVTVIVRESRSQVVYTIGKVTRPGPIALAPGMTVMQALSAAGGFAEWADQKNILIVRREGGKETQLRFNYKEFTSGEKLEQNILLKPGDTLVVP